MRKSFVFKSPQGRACGYMIEEERDLIVCVKGMTEGEALLICQSKGRQFMTYPLRGRSGESRIKKNEDGVQRAFVVRADQLLCTAGTGGSKAYELWLNERKTTSEISLRECPDNQKDSMKNDILKEVQEAKLHSIPAQSNVATGSVSRWPPPPCMPDAVYRINVWKDLSFDEA